MQKEVSYCQNNMSGSSYNGQNFPILSKKYKAFFVYKSQKTSDSDLSKLWIKSPFDHFHSQYDFVWYLASYFIIIGRKKRHQHFWTKSRKSVHSGSAQTAWLTAALNCNFFALQTCADVVWQAGTDTHIRTCTV